VKDRKELCIAVTIKIFSNPGNKVPRMIPLFPKKNIMSICRHCGKTFNPAQQTGAFSIHSGSKVKDQMDNGYLWDCCWETGDSEGCISGHHSTIEPRGL